MVCPQKEQVWHATLPDSLDLKSCFIRRAVSIATLSSSKAEAILVFTFSPSGPGKPLAHSETSAYIWMDEERISRSVTRSNDLQGKGRNWV